MVNSNLTLIYWIKLITHQFELRITHKVIIVLNENRLNKLYKKNSFRKKYFDSTEFTTSLCYNVAIAMLSEAASDKCLGIFAETEVAWMHLH